MQLLRTYAASSPAPVRFHGPAIATRLALKSICRRVLELNDEVAELGSLISTLVTALRDRRTDGYLGA